MTPEEKELLERSIQAIENLDATINCVINQLPALGVFINSNERLKEIAELKAKIINGYHPNDLKHRRRYS